MSDDEWDCDTVRPQAEKVGEFAFNCTFSDAILRKRTLFLV